MKLKPLGRKVFLESIKEERKSGIVLVDSAEGKESMWLICAMGDEVKVLSVGDEVIFNRFAVNEVDIVEKKILYGDEEDILSIIMWLSLFTVKSVN